MKRIIDKRKKEKFMMDDEYLNGQAKLCGWQGTIVYNSLCRHANINQESFPSIKLMAEQHRVSRPTIIKGIENLEKRNVIQVKKMRTKGGKWLNNTYILLDKSGWDYSSQVNVVDTVNTPSQVNVDTPPSQRGLPNQVNVVDTKETHIKETHYNSVSKETVSPFLNNKEEEDNVPFDSDAYIETLKQSQQKHIVIIGWYMQAKGMKSPGIITNKNSATIELKRLVRPASQLAVMGDMQRIVETAKKLESKGLSWTLETLINNININI